MESTILFIGEKHFAGTAAGSVIFCLRKKTVIGKIYAIQLIFCQLLKVHRHVSLMFQAATKVFAQRGVCQHQPKDNRPQIGEHLFNILT